MDAPNDNSFKEKCEEQLAIMQDIVDILEYPPCRCCGSREPRLEHEEVYRLCAGCLAAHAVEVDRE